MTHSPNPAQYLSHLHASATSEMPFSRPQTPHKELTIGFCGLGAMGYPMVRNLANRLQSPAVRFPIYVWNRTRAKGDQLAKELGESKIRVLEDLEDIARECDIVITNLANDDVVRNTYEKFANALKVRFTGRSQTR